MSNPTLLQALQQFEAVEANLTKLERLCAEALKLIPQGISFGSDPAYEDRCRAAIEVLKQIPTIDGWKPKMEFSDLDSIAQTRFDFAELGEPLAEISFERSLEEPEQELREYRFRFNKKRRALIHDALTELVDQTDSIIRVVRSKVTDLAPNEKIVIPEWDQLRSHATQIHTLLGSSVSRPDGWSDFVRHIRFGYVHDFRDIEKQDWPSIKEGLHAVLYGKDDPIPIQIEELGHLVAAKPVGHVPSKLEWSNLSDEDFERLIFALIGNEKGYENPEWLMQTRAPDRGRDLSVMRVAKDALTGTIRNRVIIQCKHWMEKSVSITEIATLKEQMKLWEAPRVDVLIIATSGRFTKDAVDSIEGHNGADSALRIEMWPESHLEMLLAARPGLIAEFGLRKKNT
jgi:restriction endonuclease